MLNQRKEGYNQKQLVDSLGDIACSHSTIRHHSLVSRASVCYEWHFLVESITSFVYYCFSHGLEHKSLNGSLKQKQSVHFCSICH